MATRQGGVYRREKGKDRRIVEPPRAQRHGAHAQHPSLAPAEVSSVMTAEASEPTRLKEADDVDTSVDA